MHRSLLIVASVLTAIVLLSGCGSTGSAPVLSPVVRASNVTSGFSTSFVSLSYPQFQVPVVSGVLVQGDTLSATNGTWVGNPTLYTYQWQDCSPTFCTNIVGGTSQTYVLQSSDVGYAMDVIVSAHNAAGVSSATSGHTAIVMQCTASAPCNTVLPTITGTTVVGSTLLSTNGTWLNSPTSYTYQWQDCNSSGSSCVNISGATSSTYVLQASDVGATIDIIVTASNVFGSSSATSLYTGVVSGGGSGPTCSSPCTSAPSISGTIQEGSVLTAQEGSWNNTPQAYTFQWEDCNASGASCSAITNSANAISTANCHGSSGYQSSCSPTNSTNWTTYTVQPSDAGHTIVLSVTATGSSTSGSAASASTSIVATSGPNNTSVPSISGTALVGDTLTAANGSWTGSGISYAYQWQDCMIGDSLPSQVTAEYGQPGCQNIPGATSSTYAVQSSDGGFGIDVLVTATNSQGSQAVQSAVAGDQTISQMNASGSTQAYEYVPVPPSVIGTPNAAGQAVLGSTLTAFYHFEGSVPSYTYQWQDCNQSGTSCSNIGGATSKTYVVASGDEGHTIRFLVTASNASGAQTATGTSSATPVVFTPSGSGAPTNSGGANLPVISGTVGYGGTVSTSAGIWSGATTMTFTYQWEDCNSGGTSCSDVTAGGNAYAYTVGYGDLGHTLRVSVTATNGSGSSSTTSAITSLVPTPSSSQQGIVPAGYTIVGNQFENDYGQPVQIHGADQTGNDYGCVQGLGFANATIDTGASAAISGWNVNELRLGVNEQCWLGINNIVPTLAGAVNALSPTSTLSIQPLLNSLYSGTYTIVDPTRQHSDTFTLPSNTFTPTSTLTITSHTFNYAYPPGSIMYSTNAVAGPQYVSDMTSYVSQLNDYGIYAMLSLTAGNPGSAISNPAYCNGTPNPCEPAAADEDHSPWYWQQLASSFATNPDVILGAFSEPNSNVWQNCYVIQGCTGIAVPLNSTSATSYVTTQPLDGDSICTSGCTNTGSASIGYYYTTAPLQQSINVMRAAGYNGPISIPCAGYANVCALADGSNWNGATWLSTVPTDPDNAIDAEAHLYDSSQYCDPANTGCYSGSLGPILSAGYPVVIGETGTSISGAPAQPNCQAEAGYTATLPWAIANDVGWNSYVWNTFGTGSLISAYEPTATPVSDAGYAACVQTTDRSQPGG